MENKYFNEAIIGNKNMLATYTAKGELQRLYFPSRENRQYISFFHTGVKINNSDLIYLHDDINNIYKQYYDTDTNVLNTEITNTYFNLTMLQTDCALIKENNVLLKRYTFINESKIDLDIEFYIHSELLSSENNHVSCKVIDSGMTQYAHDFADEVSVSSYQLASVRHTYCSHFGQSGHFESAKSSNDFNANSLFDFSSSFPFFTPQYNAINLLYLI